MPISEDLLRVIPVGEEHAVAAHLLWKQLGMWSLAAVWQPRVWSSESALCEKRDRQACTTGRKMNRRLNVLLFLVIMVGAITAGTWYYRSRCWGMDACAAAKAESHEPNKPNETQ